MNYINNYQQKLLAKKILKQRLICNIERKEFAKMINAEKKTVGLWAFL